MATTGKRVTLPIGADQRRCSTPLTGTASYAISWPLAPVGPLLSITQTSAEPGVVPTLVTTGDPEV